MINGILEHLFVIYPENSGYKLHKNITVLSLDNLGNISTIQ